jgi:alkylation response protein AidB-like acyl-CoA dehydrogenase
VAARRGSMRLVDPFSKPLEWIPEESLALVESIRRWADEKVIPVRRLIDEDWESHEICRPLLEFLCVDLGYQWAAWPKEYGGGGINAVTSALCLEEMARADAGLATAASCSVWAMSPVMPPRENPELMALYTPRFLSSDRWYVGSAAITDGRSGSDVENLDGTQGRFIATSARRDGDEWVVNGHKLWPTNSAGLADVFAVFCTTDRDGGQGAFAIVYVPADTPGVTQGKPYRKAGMSGDWNSDVWFEDVRVPAAFRAHGPGEDAEAARAFIASGNVGTAAQCLGVMRNTYELLREWCDTRVVGGKQLKEHSLTAGVLADIVTAIETSRAETYLKARMLDRPDLYGPRHTPEMLARTRVTKLFVSDQLTVVVNKAIDLMGAFGYVRESDVEKHWRDSKIMSLWMGGRALPQLDIARWFFDAQTY